MKSPSARYGALLILALTFALYARVIPAPYLWDDISLIKENPTLDDHRNLPRYFVEDLGHFNRDVRNMGFYRPMQAVTFHLETLLFGRNPAVMRSTNVLLHALSAAGLMLLAMSLGLSGGWALFAGLLFAAHPIATEQVCFIADRGGLLTAAFSIWTLVLITRAIPPEGPIRRRFLISAAVTCTLALLSKDEALTLSASALAWLYLARPKRRTEKKTYAAALLPVAVPGVLFVILKWGILGISHAQRAAETGIEFMTRAIAVPQITLHALLMCLIPVTLRPVRSVDYTAMTSPHAVLFGVVFWIIVMGLAWSAQKKSPVLTFAAFFFAATMAPSSGIVALLRPVAEHYYYLPAAGFCLVSAAIAAYLVGEKKPTAWVYALSATILIAYSVLTVVRCGYWADEKKLWIDNAQKEARNSFVLNNLGDLAAEDGHMQTARDFFTRAVIAEPGNNKARVNRANVTLSSGSTKDVFEDLSFVLDNQPCHQKALLNLGRLLVLEAGEKEKAYAERLDQTNACARLMEVGKGMMFEEKGDIEAARHAYERFLSTRPDNSIAPIIRARLTRIQTEGK